MGQESFWGVGLLRASVVAELPWQKLQIAVNYLINQNIICYIWSNFNMLEAFLRGQILSSLVAFQQSWWPCYS